MRARGGSRPRSPRERLAWLGVFWIAGVAAMGLVTGLLRWLMRLAGLA